MSLRISQVVKRATLSSLLLIAITMRVSAAEATSLEGWGEYKFGMTPEQVRAVPGLSWSDLHRESLGEATSNWIASSNTEQIARRQFGATFYFGSAEGFEDPAPMLEQMILKNSGTERTADSCEQGFIEVLDDTERGRGRFKPQHPPQAETSDALGATAWRRTPDGNSTYEWRTVKIKAVGKLVPGGDSQTATAILRSEGIRVSVRMVFVASPLSCSLSIDLRTLSPRDVMHHFAPGEP